MRSASSRAGTLSRMQPSRMRSGGPPVLRMFVCPLPTCPSRLLTRSRVSGGTIPAHAAAARSSRSAASIEGLSGSPYRVCCEESAPQPGPISSFSDPFSLATLTDHHADDHLHQVGAVVFRVTPLAQALPARAGEGQRGRIQEHNREFAEQVAPAREPLLLDEILDRARGERSRAALLV